MKIKSYTVNSITNHKHIHVQRHVKIIRHCNFLYRIFHCTSLYHSNTETSNLFCTAVYCFGEWRGFPMKQTLLVSSLSTTCIVYIIFILLLFIYIHCIINIVHTIMFCRAVFDCLVDQVGRNDTESLRCQFSFDWHYIPVGCIPSANTTLVSSKS